MSLAGKTLLVPRGAATARLTEPMPLAQRAAPMGALTEKTLSARPAIIRATLTELTLLVPPEALTEPPAVQILSGRYAAINNSILFIIIYYFFPTSTAWGVFFSTENLQQQAVSKPREGPVHKGCCRLKSPALPHFWPHE